jgi:Arc/MetJ-type ribon-helix-helix transcriptional regulator
MTTRGRLSATVDPELLAAAHAAVVAGRAESVSAWVNEALRRHAEHDARLRALDDAIAAYEAEHGEITDDEIVDATRRARARATVVRPTPDRREPDRPAPRPPRRRGAA